MQATVPVLDVFDPAFITNPYPMVARMLAESPIAFDPRLNGWLVCRHRDVVALGKDARLTSKREEYISAMLPPALAARIQPLVSWVGQWIVSMDAPEHTRLRKLGAYAFIPRNVARLEGRIREVVDGLLDAVAGKGGMEVLADLAYPLPQTIVSEMVGLPRQDLPKFIAWTTDLALLLGSALRTEDAIDHALATHRDIVAYFRELIALRRKAPVPGEVLSYLLQASEQDDRLTEEEIINLVAFIITGGYETTAHLIANGTLLLLQNPAQLARLAADPSLVAGAVEEMLRYIPSITINVRKVQEAFDFRGFRFEAGQMVYMMAIAANHDPDEFPEPQRFDITRPNASHHVSFGAGGHFCLGAPLARLEAQVAFRRIVERLPGLALPEQPLRRHPNFVVRPLEQLRVTFDS